jgi:hypothetical protein
MRGGRLRFHAAACVTETVGQALSEEAFLVWNGRCPEEELMPVGVSEPLASTVERALRHEHFGLSVRHTQPGATGACQGS